MDFVIEWYYYFLLEELQLNTRRRGMLRIMNMVK